MKKLVSCEFNMDTACVELKFTDGSMIAIDTIAIENEVADNMVQRSNLDWLIYNKPLEYAQLVLGGIMVSVKPSPAKTNRQAPTSLPVCLIIIIVFFGKIHPFPKCSLAFSVALVQKQIAVWIINLFRLLPLLEKCGFYNLKYPTVEIFARCGTIGFYAVQDKISKEIFLVHRITVF